MPPRTRAAKSSKGLKENIGVISKTKVKVSGKVNKGPRKVLGDKTNSASDDNTSGEVVKKSKVLLNNVKPTTEKENDPKPHRDRRLPSRFVDNELLNTLSKSNGNIPIIADAGSTNDRTKSSNKQDSTLSSSFKTPQKITDTSLVSNRPRRICRLPSRFEDHSISPNKFIPVKPFQASTPITQNKIKPISSCNEQTSGSIPKLIDSKSKLAKPTIKEKVKPTQAKAVKDKKVAIQKENKKASPDNNNNPKGRTLRARKAIDVIVPEQSPKTGLVVNKNKSPVKSANTRKEVESPIKVNKGLSLKVNKNKSPVKSANTRKEVESPIKVNKGLSLKVNKNKSPVKSANTRKKVESPIKVNKRFSFKVLDDNKNDSNQDVYEFTYDPNEEPAPKKKKKRVTKKRPPKPKTVIFKNNYDGNVNKALTALKDIVTRKQANKITPLSGPEIVVTDMEKTPEKPTQMKVQNAVPTVASNIPQIQRDVASKIIIGNAASHQPVGNKKDTLKIHENISINVPNHEMIPNPTLNSSNNTITKVPEPNKSIRIEDIAADFDIPLHDDLNYSPITSPHPNTNSVGQIEPPITVDRRNDPLNLKDNMSFFDEPPVASSSMNISARHPEASPWRVEFDQLPIRWHVGSYVKPNMTPAVECSFVNFEDKNRKKHVYTNLVPETNEPLPEIDKNAPNMIQQSIISFIKDVVEKSASKKKRGRSVTPKTPQLFTEETNKTPSKNTDNQTNKATRQLFTPKKNEIKEKEHSKETLTDQENSRETCRGQKRKSTEDLNNGPIKTPRKEKDNTYFGFDDSDDDQENKSPQKIISGGQKRSLRSRARAVLKEINEQRPTRAAIPLTAKANRAEIEKMYEEMKSASDAPVFPEKVPINMGTNVETVNEILNEDSQSMHLFEDIELVHHVKPQRKSYGKAKKVTFRKNTSDSDTQSSEQPIPESDNEDDDPNDLTFDVVVPFVEEPKKRKKATKKQKMTKKEMEEAEAWAAGFNSMCEDVEGFDLIVE